jgi:small-conductance mechanosensitive channel
MYFNLATRDGTEVLITNYRFVTQRVHNLSHSDNLVRIQVPFGISYGSDLKKAVAVSVNAAMSIVRILKVPEPMKNEMTNTVKKGGEKNVTNQTIG